MAAPFVANTDRAWFQFLRNQADANGRLDEANFWLPSGQDPPARFAPGDPFFFRLRSPIKAIVGFAFYATFCRLPLRDAWTTFGDRNGDPDWPSFAKRIFDYRRRQMSLEEAESRPLGCLALIHLSLWPDQLWIPWDASRGWKPNIVQGRREQEPVNLEVLMNAMQADAVSLDEISDRFRPLDADERTIVLARATRREGQGAFRARLLEAYSGACAITGERTEPVLAAAHIQPYLGPRSNHVQNGLLLTQEFHTLFDQGYVAVRSDDLTVRVSPRLQKDFGNGRRYAEFHGQRIINLPADSRFRPSPEALDWHHRKLFKAG
jgi:putative restriction endonuclease